MSKEKVSHIDVNDSFESNLFFDKEGNGIHVVELNPGPPYMCKDLSPILSKDNSKIATWSQKVYGLIKLLLVSNKIK